MTTSVLNEHPTMTASEAAAYLGISAATLWRRTEPRGPIKRINMGGKAIRYNRRYIHKLVDTGIEDIESPNTNP